MGTIGRHGVLKDLAALGALPGLSAALLSHPAAAELLAAAQAQSAAPPPDPDTRQFWDNFVSATSRPAARISSSSLKTMTERGEISSSREAFFFHYTKEGFQPAMDIPPSQLLPEGDVTVRYNVAAFKPADVDRSTLERLQNAQLRLDVLQVQPILPILETLAWTAVAVLNPDQTKKLPPLQSLSFDPGAATDKMRNIVLPGGEGRWSVNLYAQRKDSLFSQIVMGVLKDFGKFVPILGLPGITTVALDSFNRFYGAMHSRPEYLFRMNPVPVFATASALTSSGASRGLPLRTGTYVLVPIAHAVELTGSVLDGLELKQGFIVPKDTPSTHLYDAAEAALPHVTYATVDVGVQRTQLTGPAKSG
jgi:hypothetical protein